MKRIFIWVLFICLFSSALGYILYRYNRIKQEKQQYIVQKNKIKNFKKKVKKSVDKSKAKRYNRRAVRETAEKKPVMRQQMNLEK